MLKNPSFVIFNIMVAIATLVILINWIIIVFYVFNNIYKEISLILNERRVLIMNRIN